MKLIIAKIAISPAFTSFDKFIIIYDVYFEGAKIRKIKIIETGFC